MESLKQLLLNCQVYLQQGDWDKLLEALDSITQQDIEKLDLKTAEECLGILNYLIKEGEEIRNGIANNLINIKRFKDSYIP
ncbi:MAG: hypothetical protein N3D14_02110 [Aquificaceae bacterium]|nr:hypothetical protein [Aquificaceae bacterium]